MPSVRYRGTPTAPEGDVLTWVLWVLVCSLTLWVALLALGEWAVSGL